MGQILSGRAQKFGGAGCEAWPQLCSKENVSIFIEGVQGGQELIEPSLKYKRCNRNIIHMSYRLFGGTKENARTSRQLL